LHVSQAETPNAHMIVSGNPGYVEARGMTLSGAVIQMLRGANRLWVDGAGRMTLPMQGQLTGQRGPGRSGVAAGQRPATAPSARPFGGGIGGGAGPGGARSGGAGPGAGAQPVQRRPPAPSSPLEITWQGKMEFDGLTAMFDRSVLARTEHQNLRAALLQVTLKRRVDFNNPPPADSADPDGANEVDVVDCRGDVRLEARSFDEKGLESIDQMELITLTVNQTTGAIAGQGPGWVNTVRRDGEKNAQAPSAATGGGNPTGAKPPTASAPANAAGAGKGRAARNDRAARPNALAGGGASSNLPADGPDAAKPLSYLHVTFERDLRGNLNRRELTFADQVRATFGPVADWRDSIDPDDLKSVGPSGIVMTCDELTVREAPSAIRADRGTMEMEAIGGALVEGQTFTARAHRLTYAEAKDLLVFEGNGRTDAKLYRQAQPRTPPTEATARKILFWRSQNRAEVDDARYIDLTMPGNDKQAPFKDPLMKKK
jgi:hypothetical protein